MHGNSNIKFDTSSTERPKGFRTLKNVRTFMISGFRREIDESCALLGYYAASSGSSLPTFRNNLSGPIFKDPEFKKKKIDR